MKLKRGKAGRGIYNLSHIVYCVSCVSNIQCCGTPLPVEKANNEVADHAAAEAKTLKKISFPEMDSDGLPSSYALKVLSALGKWQIKMVDLSGQLDSSNTSMKP